MMHGQQNVKSEFIDWDGGGAVRNIQGDKDVFHNQTHWISR